VTKKFSKVLTKKTDKRCFQASPYLTFENNKRNKIFKKDRKKRKEGEKKVLKNGRKLKKKE
jgi:hypothetical protein